MYAASFILWLAIPVPVRDLSWVPDQAICHQQMHLYRRWLGWQRDAAPLYPIAPWYEWGEETQHALVVWEQLSWGLGTDGTWARYQRLMEMPHQWEGRVPPMLYADDWLAATEEWQGGN